MRVCIQRVAHAEVLLKETGRVLGKIGPGLLVLLGICESDTEQDVHYLAQKTATLRIFEDEAGKMNRGLLDVKGEMLLVSQFTLYADCRKGRRPSFTDAARPERAVLLYERFLEEIREMGIPVASGEFQQEMSVALTNDGPVTIWIDSAEAIARSNDK